jgi:acyl carrier protein
MNHLLPEKDAKAVLEILTEELGVQQSQLTTDARLKEDLGADSLSLVEINMALEDRFNLSIPDERLERVQTVGDIFELLAELLQSPSRR